MQDYDYLFKILLIGNTSVGKSSLLLRFSDNVFGQSFLPTIGVDFKARSVSINNLTIKLQIWDTAGQQRFKTITSSYYKGAKGIILVYDIADRQSFRDIESWLAEIDKFANKEVVRLLVGNKSDEEKARQVTVAEGRGLAGELGMRFMETSAKNAQNVEKVLTELTREILERDVVGDTNGKGEKGEVKKEEVRQMIDVSSGRVQKRRTCL